LSGVRADDVSLESVESECTEPTDDALFDVRGAPCRLSSVGSSDAVRTSDRATAGGGRRASSDAVDDDLVLSEPVDGLPGPRLGPVERDVDDDMRL